VGLEIIGEHPFMLSRVDACSQFFNGPANLTLGYRAGA
jgi:hypothetical protein